MAKGKIDLLTYTVSKTEEAFYDTLTIIDAPQTESDAACISLATILIGQAIMDVPEDKLKFFFDSMIDNFKMARKLKIEEREKAKNG